jgi:hypothetical protein
VGSTDRQPDRQTDRQAGRQTDTFEKWLTNRHLRCRRCCCRCRCWLLLLLLLLLLVAGCCCRRCCCCCCCRCCCCYTRYPPTEGKLLVCERDVAVNPLVVRRLVGYWCVFALPVVKWLHRQTIHIHTHNPDPDNVISVVARTKTPTQSLRHASTQTHSATCQWTSSGSLIYSLTHSPSHPPTPTPTNQTTAPSSTPSSRTSPARSTCCCTSRPRCSLCRNSLMVEW